MNGLTRAEACAIERAFHHEYRDKRVSGEWFDVPGVSAVTWLQTFQEESLVA